MKRLTVHKTVTIVASVTHNLPSPSAATAAKDGWERHVKNLVSALSTPWTVACVCAMTTAHTASIVSQCATTTSGCASMTTVTVSIQLQVSIQAITGSIANKKVVLECLIVNVITTVNATRRRHACVTTAGMG